ncbi:MAG TPA: Cys-tRNA(Pro) deacylase, partial [Oscillospiraceae bacterium]|nr:Cys-tRNA(Pro) deacylase [Oscillospiraceae bacterium]
MSNKEDKTNVMRMLEQKKIPYTPHGYEHDGDEAVDALSVAEKIGIPLERIYKTLVTQGASGGYFVFVVPGGASLDLKKAAKVAGEKFVVMVKVPELLPLTGYVRGGCSPIGMKKEFPTYIDRSALDFEKIGISAGKQGEQLLLDPKILTDGLGITP